MAQDIIELRTGQFSALFISINSSSLTAIKRALAKKNKTSPSLFKNIEVILQFNPMLEKVNLIALKDLLAEYQIRLIGVADWQNHLQRELILAANLSILGNVNNLSEILPEPRDLPTKIVPHNVIDKQVIYAKNSDSIYTQYLDAEFIAVNSRFLYKEKIPTEFLYRSVRIFAEKDQLIFHPF